MAERAFPLILIIEPKDEAGAEPGYPATGELAVYVTGLLADETKHDSQLGYRVLRAVPLVPGSGSHGVAVGPEPGPDELGLLPQDDREQAVYSTAWQAGWRGLPDVSGAIADPRLRSVCKDAWERGSQAGAQDRVPRSLR